MTRWLHSGWVVWLVDAGCIMRGTGSRSRAVCWLCTVARQSARQHGANATDIDCCRARLLPCTASRPSNRLHSAHDDSSRSLLVLMVARKLQKLVCTTAQTGRCRLLDSVTLSVQSLDRRSSDWTDGPVTGSTASPDMRW